MSLVWCVGWPQVRGVEDLRAFSQNLVRPYSPPTPRVVNLVEGTITGGGPGREAALEAEVATLKARVAQLEAQLEAATKKK